MPSLTSVTSPQSERPLTRALITSPTATRSNCNCPYPCVLAPRARGESRAPAAFAALRRTLTACREDPCRQRLEQNRASTRTPAGIGPPHHAHVSARIGGREDGRVLQPRARGGLPAALRAVWRLRSHPRRQKLAAALARARGLPGIRRRGGAAAPAADARDTSPARAVTGVTSGRWGEKPTRALAASHRSSSSHTPCSANSSRRPG